MHMKFILFALFFAFPVLSSTDPNQLDPSLASPLDKDESEAQLFVNKDKPGALFGKTVDQSLWKVSFGGPIGFSPKGTSVPFHLDTLQKLHARYSEWLNSANPPTGSTKNEVEAALKKIPELVLKLKHIPGECYLFELADDKDKYVQLKDGQFAKISFNGATMKAEIVGKNTTVDLSQVKSSALDEIVEVSTHPKEGFKNLFDGPNGYVYGLLSDGSKRYLKIPANKNDGLLIGETAPKEAFVPEETMNEWAQWMVKRAEKEGDKPAFIASLEGASAVLLHRRIAQYENGDEEESPLVFMKGYSGYKYFLIKRSGNPKKSGVLLPVRKVKLAKNGGKFERRGKTISYPDNTLLVEVEHMGTYAIKGAADLRKKTSLSGIDMAHVTAIIEDEDDGGGGGDPLFKMINRYRRQNGLNRLMWDPSLCIADNQAHTVAKSMGLRSNWAGDTGVGAFNMWLSSSDHNTNMLAGGTRGGIGYSGNTATFNIQ